MIEDLVFKGKSLDECLNKAANFFGVNADGIKYEFVEEAPQGEVWIQLTENPILARRVPPGQSSSPQFQEQRRGETGTGSRQHPDQRRGGRGKPQQRGRGQNQRGAHGERKGGSRHTQRGSSSFKQRSGPPRRDNWKRAEVDISTLADPEKEVYQFVCDVLRRMRMRVDVFPTQDQTRLILNLDGPDRGLLLNRKGEPLIAIQYLVNKIYMSRGETRQPVFIDSMGYRVARDEELQEIAYSSAEKVRATGQEYQLAPMNPYERRQIHVTLKDEEGVSTVSHGEGYIKRISVIPTEQGAE